MTWEKIIEELKKCILLCANCHAEIHSLEQNYSFLGNGLDNSFINREIVSTGKCPICDAEVFGTRYCGHKCSQFASRKVKERPSKEILIEKIKSMTMVAIGKEYNVSDNAVRKWIKSYEIIP